MSDETNQSASKEDVDAALRSAAKRCADQALATAKQGPGTALASTAKLWSEAAKTLMEARPYS